MADRTRSQAGWLAGMGLALIASVAHAQMPTTAPEEAPAKKRVTPVAAAPAGPGAAEELPWLATTTSGPEKAKGQAAATPADGGAAPKPASKKPAAKTAQKCEAQEEEGCRAATNCAWVAAIPQGDGTVTAARCAERKAQAPAKKKKPAVAAKPKPAEAPAATAAAAEKAPEAPAGAARRTTILEPRAERPPVPVTETPKAETANGEAAEAKPQTESAAAAAEAVAPAAPVVEAAPAPVTESHPSAAGAADSRPSIPGLVIVE